jgi:hypothetical protein
MCSRHKLLIMKEQGSGYILNITSVVDGMRTLFLDCFTAEG